jgi:predicted PurR-regulated permease PerM
LCLSFSGKFNSLHGGGSEKKNKSLTFKKIAFKNGSLISGMPQTYSLQKVVFFLLFVFLFVSGLHYAKPFFVPMCFGGLLAMLFVPLSLWFERRKIPRGLAIFFCIIIFLAILTGIIWVISWQITDLTSEATDIENKVREIISRVQEYIRIHFGISIKQQDEMIARQAENSGSLISRLGSSLAGFVVNFILVLVYIFLFMYYRKRIKTFILQLVPSQQKKNAEEIIHDIQKVSQLYLTGLGLMILSLWIMYGIGFSIVGVKYAILFGILCGLFELVPFIGNLTGNLLAMLMVVLQGGGMGMVIGVLLTYLIVQFLQTYLLEPLVVGAEVNINPLFTIIILVLGELVWGIPGLVLAIPLLGIVKIICDHIDPLKPYGYLIGSDKKKRPLVIQAKK